MSLATVRSRHYANNVLDTDRFAVDITLKDESGTEYEVAALVQQRDQQAQEANSGLLVLMEQVTITVAKSGLATKPGLKWRLYLSGDDRGYMYAYDQEIDDHVYVSRFERPKNVAIRTQ